LNNDIKLSDESCEKLSNIMQYCPIFLETQTREYIRNLFESGFSTNGFYNNIYLNMYQYYIFILHSFLVRAYKFYVDDKSLHVLHKMKIIGKKIKDNLKIENIKHNTFNSLEKDSVKHLSYLLDFEEDTNFQKRHSDIFALRDNVSHFNEFSITENLFNEYIDKMIDNITLIQQFLYKKTKETIYDEINSTVSNDLIDDTNYNLYFEDLNKKYYLTYFDYQSLKTSGYLNDIPNNITKAYIKKYIEETLQLEEK